MKIFYVAPLLFLILFYGCESSILDDPSIVIKYSASENSNIKLTIENS